MLFSVIVPVYNVEKYLDECLQSILCQANKDMIDCEIILIDDGSTDKSGNICDEYQKKNPDLIKVFHNTNHGLLFTRRYGYERAKGEYVINCDSDDKLEPDMFSNLKRMIEKYNSPDMILFNYYSFMDGRKKYDYTNIFTNKLDCSVSKEKVLKEFMLRHSVVSIWGKVYRRICIDVKRDYTNWVNVSNGEDTLQSIEFFNNANTFVYLNKALYDYRMGSGMTRKFDPNYYFGFKTVLGYLETQKEIWNLQNFDQFFAVKVLQTVGRSITQSRYHKWTSMKEHKEYLRRIVEDEMVKKNILMLDKVKKNIQKNHVIVLKLLLHKIYFPIIISLNIKNFVKKEKSIK